MTQGIITKETVTLSPNPDIREDAANIIAAINAAVEKAHELGGHQQEIHAVEVGDFYTVDAWIGSPIQRTAVLTIRTRLI